MNGQQPRIIVGVRTTVPVVVLYVDGATGVSDTGGTNPSGTLTRWTYGDTGSEYLVGIMGDLIVTASAVSGVNLERIEGYLAHKWQGVGSDNSLPSSHSYKYEAP